MIEIDDTFNYENQEHIITAIDKKNKTVFASPCTVAGDGRKFISDDGISLSIKEATKLVKTEKKELKKLAKKNK